MANIECSACENLRQNAPDFVINGFSDDNCENLTGNLGLTGNSDNCTDISDLNDCLVGMMANEVNTYDTCDWKKFMKQKFIPNVWTTIKSIICWLCGLQCTTNYLGNGDVWSFGEQDDSEEDVKSKLKAGRGVDFTIRTDRDVHSNDVEITYVGGSLAYVHGSLRTFPTKKGSDTQSTFTDANGNEKPCNAHWNFSENDFTLPNGGELLYEIRLKKSEFPMIKRFFRGDGWNGGGGQQFFQTAFNIFDGDNIPDGQEYRYAWGQHGWCDEDGTPTSSGYSNGHIVKHGWIYIQCRMLYVANIPITEKKDGAKDNKWCSSFSPHGYMGVRINTKEIEC